MRLFLPGGGGAFTPPTPPDVTPYTVASVWMGDVTDDAVTFKFRSTDATEASVLVSTNPGLTSPITEAATEGADDMWTATVSGLAADTQYYYGFDGDEDSTGQFRSLPTPGSTHSFLVAAAGDTGNSETYGGITSSVANPPTWQRMLEHDPLFIMLMGDLHYRNLNTSNPQSYRNAIRDALAETRVNAAFRLCPVQYCWDDHDFGPNNSNGTFAHKLVVAAVNREVVPHWSLAEANALYATWVVGRVRFIQLDCRYYKSTNGSTDNSAKRRLGATQEAWLEDVLTAATEPVIVVNVMSWIGVTTSFSDGWQGFTTARRDMFDVFRSTGTFDRIFLIGADIHELMYDDGTNTNFETGASVNGPPYCNFAPIDCSFNHFAATAQQVYQTRKQQYGTLEFVDSGSDIEVIATGYALSSNPGATSSAQFTESTVYPG